MSFWDDILASGTLDGMRSTVIAYATTSGLAITDWIVGAVGQQMIEAFTQTMFAESEITSQAIRGFASLDTSTDPGDVDAYDANNVNMTPAPGFLSNLGKNFYGTERGEESFASGFVTFDNTAGIVPRTFSPQGLVFTWTGGSPPSPAPVYYNSADPTIYTNADGSVTVPAGGSLTLPIKAFQAGTGSNAPPSTITLTTTLVGVTCTNAASVTGVDREDADLYRANCRRAGARGSTGGARGTIAYFAQKNLDGTPLLNASGNPVNNTRIQKSADNATGIAGVYFASDSGASTAEDVTAANDNIELETWSVFGCVTYTGAAATEVLIPVVGTGKIKAGPGITAAAVKAAIVADLVAAFKNFDIGGDDQVAGAGVIYTTDLRAIAANAYPGLYNVAVTTPAGASTALALGEVATYAGTVSDWTITVVP